jgi:hypothetical protein
MRSALDEARSKDLSISVMLVSMADVLAILGF